MADYGKFAIELSAGIAVDKGSLSKAQREISGGLGKPAMTPAAAAGSGGGSGGSGVLVKFGQTQTQFGWLGRLLTRGVGSSAGGGLGRGLATNALGVLGKQTAVGSLAAGKFDLHIAGIRKTLAANWHMGGLGRTVETMGRLRNVASEARGVLGDIARLMPGGAIVAGLGTAAGLATGIAEFGARGQGIQNAAMASGVSPRALQGFRLANELEGGTAADATASLQGVNQSLLNANAGTGDGVAAMTAKQLRLNTRVSPDQFLLNLAGSAKFQAANAATQQRILDAFKIQQGMLPLLRKGRAGMLADIAQGERNALISDADVQRAAELGRAVTSTAQAIGGLVTAIEAKLSPALTPMLKNWNDWIIGLKSSPAAMDKVTAAVDALALGLGALAAAPAIKMLAGLAGSLASLAASPFVAFLATLALKGDSGPVDSQPPAEGKPFSWRDWSTWFQHYRAPGGGPLGGQSPREGASRQLSGLTPPLGSMVRAIMQVESKGGTVYNAEPMPGHSATGPMQIQPGTFARFARPGEKLDNPVDNIGVGTRMLQTFLGQGYSLDDAAKIYANGSLTAPDLNPGYVYKFDVALAAQPGPHLDPTKPLSAQPGFAAVVAAEPATAADLGVGGAVSGAVSRSEHNVNINLTGAPYGARVDVNGHGPASVRTDLQFASPW